MRFSVLLLILAALVLVGCAPLPAPTPTTDPNIRAYDPPLPLIDFQLIDQTGGLVKLSDLRGKLAVFSFGFIHCPDVCPVNLANYKLVKQQLGQKADKVAFVFISVDGERDTPDVLAAHLKLFDASFIGLTGDEALVRPVANVFAVRYEKYVPEGTQADYLVNHTASWFVVDASGNLIRSYAYGTPPEVIAQDLVRFIPE